MELREEDAYDSLRDLEKVKQKVSVRTYSYFDKNSDKVVS